MSNDRDLDQEIDRILVRAGITPHRGEKTPDWIGSFDGAADLSENLDAYKRKAIESAAKGRRTREQP